MPSGPKKRKAARRRSLGPGLRLSSADKESLSGSRASDEGTSPKTSDDVSSTLSLTTKERPSDQTFQTEEWVRVSDFDVGTPTSTTADSKGDYDAAAEDSYGEVRGHDKLADWETVSRDTVGNSSSAEDVGEAHLVVDESLGSSQDQGQKLPHVDEGKSESSSDKEGEGKSELSSSDKEDDDGNSTSSTRTSSSDSAQEKLEEDGDRSSSVEGVPPPQESEDDGHESSFAEVASLEAQQDEDSGNMLSFTSPDVLEIEHQASGTVKAASPEQQDEEICGNVLERSLEKEPEDNQFSSTVTDVLAHPKVEDEGSLNNFAAIEKTEAEDHQLPEVEGPEPQALQLDPQTPDATERERHGDSVPEVSSEHNSKDSESVVEESQTAVEESHSSIEPTTPDKIEDKSQPKNAYDIARYISLDDEEQPSSTLEVSAVPEAERISESAEVSSSEVQGDDENIAKELHDAPISCGIPEPEQHELDQLLEIAHSKEIGDLGRQEEKILAKEEEEIGKDIVEPQPLAEVLAASDEAKPLEGGELQDLQPVAVEDTPLVQDAQVLHDSSLQEEAENRARAPETFDEGSGEQLLVQANTRRGKEDETVEVLSVGEKDLHPGEEEKSLAMEESNSADQSLQTEALSAEKEEEDEQRVEREDAKEEPSLVVDYSQGSQSAELPISSGKGTVVQLRELTDSELLKNFAERSKGAEAAGLSGNGVSSGGPGGSPHHLQQYISPKKAEEQGRPREHWEGASELRGGCCDPVQWLFARFFGTRVIQN